MNQTQTQKILLGIAVLVVLVGVALLIFSGGDNSVPDSLYNGANTATTSQPATNQPAQANPRVETLGTSLEGRGIKSYTYGNGASRLLFVGAIHGGYEYNSALLAYRLMDYLEANPSVIPQNVSVTVVPNLNPDGMFAVVGKEGRFSRADLPADIDTSGTGRFNANGVDLNRNFACSWQPTSTWRGQEVSAGTAAFSEPEARAIQTFVGDNNIAAGVFFHSAAGAVYGAACDGTIGPKTKRLVDTYASASGYRAVDLFTAYPITGDVESWLTKLGIPAVSVELSNHSDVEWEKNLSGIKAVLGSYADKN